MYRLVLGFVLMLVVAAMAGAAEPTTPAPFGPGRRIVFLGDSITYAGPYVQYFDAYMQTRYPDLGVEVLNLGLPSETVSGLSEPDHPWPRPNVHERLDRVLKTLKPSVVVACYGMNDGIYHPYSRDRFLKFSEGILSLVAKVRAAGAEIILVTPSMFDAEPLGDKTQPITATNFSWVRPYSGYDDVLARYSAWLLGLEEQGVRVADAHTFIRRYMEAARFNEPTYTLAADGVHPNPAGGWLLTHALLDRLGVTSEAGAASVDVLQRTASPGVDRLRQTDGGWSFRWQTALPLPIDPEWKGPLLKETKLVDRFSRFTLKVIGLEGNYDLYEDSLRLATVTGEALEAGVDLTRFSELTANRRAREVLEFIRRRERLLGGAYLDAAGHKRPDTPKGKPLAEALRLAAPLTARIAEQTRPVRMNLRLLPGKP